MVTGFIQLALGDQHSMVIRQDGSVWSTAITLRGDPLRGATHFAQVRFTGLFESQIAASFRTIIYRTTSTRDFELYI